MLIEDLFADLLEDAVDLITDAGEYVIDAAKDGIDYISDNGVDEIVDVAKTTASTTLQALYDKFK